MSVELVDVLDELKGWLTGREQWPGAPTLRRAIEEIEFLRERCATYRGREVLEAEEALATSRSLATTLTKKTHRVWESEARGAELEDALRFIRQTVHQAHHEKPDPTRCPVNTCQAATRALGDGEAGAE